jgi:hypothetical protein
MNNNVIKSSFIINCQLDAHVKYLILMARAIVLFSKKLSDNVESLNRGDFASAKIGHKL